jgi:hypothetical protein
VEEISAGAAGHANLTHDLTLLYSLHRPSAWYHPKC